MFCSKCGQKLNGGDVFCNKCGNRVASAPDTPVTPDAPEKSPDGKSRLAYQVLALSFGWFGLHNFYARRILPACAQILLTAAAVVLCITQGVFWTWFLPVAAWCIIEIFAVRKDGKGIP